jgi:RNA polymerase-binding transcription factor DksA
MAVKVNLKEITETLKHQREILITRLEGASESDPNGKSFNPDRTDLARSYQESHRNKLLIARTEKQLIAIDKALLRIKDGTYSQCENCGSQIAIERLGRI